MFTDLRWFVVVDIGGIVDHQTIFCVFTDLRWFVVVDIGHCERGFLLLILDLRWFVVVDIGGGRGLLLILD